MCDPLFCDLNDKDTERSPFLMRGFRLKLRGRWAPGMHKPIAEK